MTTTLFLLFSHQITEAQEADAFATLGVKQILSMPSDLQAVWSNIPADRSELSDYLEPVRRWLSFLAQKGDHVLIQGDFGACYLMVSFALDHDLVPVYSTTRRDVEEELQADGTTRLTHHFRHQRFRRYAC